MVDILWSILSFLIAFGILVTVHEYGHFMAARQCGVQVEIFSIGLGKPLCHWHDKLGTRYVIALIPLGGYVKMLDTRIEDVPKEKYHLTFNAQPLLQRSWIILAGPLANFILAIVLAWCLYLSGVNTFKAVVVGTQAQSMVGDFQIDKPVEVIRVQGQPTQTFEDVQLALAHQIGRKDLTMEFAELENDTRQSKATFNIENWRLDQQQPTDLLSSLGFILYQPHVLPVIAKVLPQSPAEHAGLKSGDTLLSINQIPYQNWSQFVGELQAAKEAQVRIDVLREQQKYSFLIQAEMIEQNGVQRKRIGILPQVEPIPEKMRTEVKYGMFDGFVKACAHVWDLSQLTLSMIKQLIMGTVSLNQLGGPVSIAQSAGQSFSVGWQSFVSFLVFFSVNLGVINLLPIPVLDGGHLLYNMFEAIRGKQLSEHIQEIGFKIGVAILFSMMAIALFNDMMRLSIF